MRCRLKLWLCLLMLTLLVGQVGRSEDLGAQDQPGAPKRVLLLGQKPDGHPPTTHEYMAGVRLLAKLLQDQGLQLIVVQADEPWPEGPELLDAADGAVLFLSEGAKWIQSDPTRLAAFQRLARRGGGLAVLHWGMGTRAAEPIDEFVRLFGACHGGPDRKYKVAEFRLSVAATDHPITQGVGPLDVRDEFYYALKTSPKSGRLTPLVTVPLDNTDQMVGWAWERQDGGRSFGFSGLHFHANWSRPEYRRLVAQGILWTLKQPIPNGGLPVPATEEDLKLP